MKALTIAIDGPASSGKSTIAKQLAQQLHYIYCDTGAMYRALTYLVLQEKVDPESESAVAALLRQHEISFQQLEAGQRVFVDEKDVTEAIRQPDVTNLVSVVAKHKEVRAFMVNVQRDIASQSGVIMDGRDIGTAVLPHADVKIFLVASVTERAQRRYKENLAKGIATDLPTLTKEIEQRDYLDSSREISPLKQASDAILVDTTGMSVNEVIQKVMQIIQKKQTK